MVLVDGGSGVEASLEAVLLLEVLELDIFRLGDCRELDGREDEESRKDAERDESVGAPVEDAHELQRKNDEKRVDIREEAQHAHQDDDGFHQELHGFTLRLVVVGRLGKVAVLDGERAPNLVVDVDVDDRLGSDLGDGGEVRHGVLLGEVVDIVTA